MEGSEPQASIVFEGTGAPFSLDHLTGLQKAGQGLDLSLAISAQRPVSEAHRKPPPRAGRYKKAKRSREEVPGKGVSFNAPHNPFSVEQGLTLWGHRKETNTAFRGFKAPSQSAGSGGAPTRTS